MDPDDPGSPSQTPFKTSPSPIPIKQEPQDDAGLFQNTEQGEIISLISDDEDETSATANVRSLGSPFREPPSKKTLPNLGSSLLSKPKTTIAAQGASGDAHKLYREKLLDKAHKGAQETAQRFRNDSRQAKRTRTSAQPAGDGFFVTDSRPGTPDAAEVFSALEQDFVNKRQRGTLTTEEDIQFQRVKDVETARVSKQNSDMAYDMTHEGEDEGEGEDSEEGDMEEGFDLSRLSTLMNDDTDETEPKKRGLKRKAPTSSKPPKKRGRPAKEVDTEELIAKARLKAEAKSKSKGKGKGKGKATATKAAGASKGGRKARPAQPNLLNTASMRNNDVFEDAAQNADLPNQPTFGPTFDPTTKKAKALKDLIASVPEEYRPIAKADKKYLDDATKDFTGRGVVNPAPDGNWSVKGLKVTLKHYQVLGVAFMRKRENSTRAPKGGLLADTMGLGKTIMMLANIVNGKSLQKTNCRTTLIVASAALVSQWRREIADKVCTIKESKFGIGRVREYHASAQTKSNEELEELQECDIILTTYTQVQKSYPKAEIPAQYTSAQQKVDWWNKHYEENKGVLHRIKWHRVVLDESQAIKNHQSLTSMACRALEAKHYWAMSGTPLLNRVDEFYSTFKFLREPNAGSLKLFRQNFCSENDPDGLEKLDVFLRKFMIRRTHLDTFFNARLIDLPTPKKTTIWLDFNEIERSVYDIVKVRFITRINSFSKSGELDRQYGYVSLSLSPWSTCA
jgi:SNF2 family DNA or RNA helicase